jgi:hypothetical protein
MSVSMGKMYRPNTGLSNPWPAKAVTFVNYMWVNVDYKAAQISCRISTPLTALSTSAVRKPAHGSGCGPWHLQNIFCKIFANLKSWGEDRANASEVLSVRFLTCCLLLYFCPSCSVNTPSPTLALPFRRHRGWQHSLHKINGLVSGYLEPFFSDCGTPVYMNAGRLVGQQLWLWLYRTEAAYFHNFFEILNCCISSKNHCSFK